jgi:hypothetical protein
LLGLFPGKVDGTSGRAILKIVWLILGLSLRGQCGLVQAACETSATYPKPRQGQLLCHIFHNAIAGFLDENENNTVEVKWAPGHQDIPGNDRADDLAKAGVELESVITGTRAAGLRKAKGKLIRTWTKEWKSRPKSGRFAMADRMPPKLKATERFIKTKREVFGRLVQCRTGHGFLGEYYNQFVPDENVDCPCGEPFQTREHILRDCPKYQTHRHILEEESRDISLPEILGTEKGIEALIDFLEESGAFTKTWKPISKPREPSFDDEPNPAEDEDEDPPRRAGRQGHICPLFSYIHSMFHDMCYRQSAAHSLAFFTV